MTSKSHYTNCRHCNKKTRIDISTCSHCGKSKGRRWVKYFKYFAVGCLCLVVVSFILPDRETATESQEVKSTDTLVKRENVSYFPSSQRRLIEIIDNAQISFRKVNNEIDEFEIREERAKKLRSALPNLTINSWVGKVKNIDITSDGNVIFELKLPNSITIGTWNNSLSDYFDKTIIENNTQLYNVIKTLRRGDEVEFDGTFLSSNKDHLSETSLTKSGSINSPDFLIYFDTIRKVKD